MKINDINNPINENTDMTTGDVKYLVSDGAQRYFIFVYPAPPKGNPMHLKNQLDDKAKELGFKKRNVVAQWAGDINMEIAKAKKTMAKFEDRKKDFPSQYYGSVKTAEQLEAAKDIMSNEDILEDTPLLDDVEDMTEIDDMEHTDEPAISGEDVLRMAAQRGIISRKQYNDPEPILLDMADGMADMLTPGDIAGSSDVSSLMKDFVTTAEAELVLLLGPKVDAYYAIKKDRPVAEKVSDKRKSAIRKIQSTGKGKTRPLVKLAKMGDKQDRMASERPVEEDDSPMNAINKFLQSKNDHDRK